MARVDADIWVLTEAHMLVPPSGDYELVARSTRLDAEDSAESWVAIWSRLGGTQVGTADDDRTAAAVITGIGNRRLVVYGTVLPWLGSTWREYPAADGAAFNASLAVQMADWRKFASNSHLCVVGDLNQDLLAKGKYYGSAKNRVALKNALREVGLNCPTSEPVDLVQQHTGGAAAGIDHICMSRSLVAKAETAAVWPTLEERSARLSDHFGVTLRLSAS
jgi:hypothetical protein